MPRAIIDGSYPRELDESCTANGEAVAFPDCFLKSAADAQFKLKMPIVQRVNANNLKFDVMITPLQIGNQRGAAECDHDYRG